MITLLYLSYIVGIFMGPTAGRFSNRHGKRENAHRRLLVLGLSLGVIMLPFIAAVVCGLLGICAGFFAVHASAVGALKRRLSGGQGRANALYVLFYYLGGWGGITLSGFAYTHWGWNGVVLLCLLLVIVPLSAGIGEMNYRKQDAAGFRKLTQNLNRILPVRSEHSVYGIRLLKGTKVYLKT